MSKIILLTGGTGSFGKGFVEMLLNLTDVSMIRVFSRDEHKQREMKLKLPSDRVSYFIGDVRDADRLRRAMDGVDWVVHAAALKQAPLGEIEPQEFIKTNIQGTLNVIEACLDENVEKAILISTDKAVEPINLYGATKMCAERAFIQADAMRGTKQCRFACVRYGNVAGTNGSIIPVLQSLRPDGEITIYDEKATRFWISLKEANQFVLESLKVMRGGEVFIPRLKSVKVLDVAKAIRPELPIKIVDHRKGDKTHEVLDLEPRYSSDNNEFMTVEEIRNHVFNHDRLGTSSQIYS